MFLLAASPGPGVFAVVSRSLSSGFRKSLFMIAGVVTGDLVYLVFAIFGLTFIAKNLSDLFTVIRLLGGAYLIYGGLKTAMAKGAAQSEGKIPLEDTPPLTAYLGGLAVTISNPKAILFYCGFLPAFTDLSKITLREGVLISFLVVMILGSVMSVYAYLAHSAGRKLNSPSGQKWMNRGAGAVMATAGTLLIAKK